VPWPGQSKSQNLGAIVNGTIVIEEGERDEAPMLFIGEMVGTKKPGNNFHEVDITVDPLDGTNLCTWAPGAIAVLASSAT